ncbi:MAG: DUF3189 family protein [Methylocystaceae bacterium]
MFYDYGGSHTSIVAANLLTGHLNDDLPSGKELMALPLFDKTTPRDFAVFQYNGEDKSGNPVYTLGTKSGTYGYALAALTKLMDAEERFMHVGTMPCLNNTLRIGGFLSRSLNLPFIGRPLVIIGLRKAFPKLRALVKHLQVGRLKEI